jgi:hypothetical protein
MSLAAREELPADRPTLIRQAFRFEYITLGWMTIEAAVAIGSGLAAQSLVLIAPSSPSSAIEASGGLNRVRRLVRWIFGEC